MKGLVIDRDTGDLAVSGGSLVIGEIEGQVAEIVVKANRGDIKESPLIGGEAEKMLGGERDVLWAGRLKKMLRACGLEVRNVKISENEITIE